MALSRSQAAEVARLMELAIKIIDTNLYLQREKVADASEILREAVAIVNGGTR